MMPSTRWSTLPPSAVFAVLIGVPVFAAIMLQLITVGITAPDLLRGGNRLSLPELLGLWGQKDPTVVTGASIPGWLHWVTVSMMLTLIIAVSALIARIIYVQGKDPQRKKGLAPLSDVVKQLGERALMQQYGPQLRPAVAQDEARPTDYGYRVGAFWKLPCYLRVEDPTIVIGPSRSGKGWYLILNWLVDAPGAVITTSSKMDNAIMTMQHRKRVSPDYVRVFAPGIAGGESLGHVLNWDPIAGCLDEEALIRRIHALVPSGAFSGTTTNAGHWDSLGQQLSASLFHAAACADADVDKIWEWVTAPNRAFEAVDAIRRHPEGMPEYARYIEAVLQQPDEQRSNSWGVLTTVLAFLASRSARKWMTPAPGSEIDLVQFLLNKGTLYLVGDKQTTNGYVRIIDGLLAEVDYVSKGLADAMGGRLDPPVTYLLDEAGNFEYQGLYELITAGGGRGRIGVPVFQAKDQLGQYGRDNMKALWDAAVAKIILPGGADNDDLRAMSSLVGERWVKREQHSFGHGDGSVSVGEEKREILTASEIREMTGGYGLLFYRNMKPVIPKLNPFSSHENYSQFKEDGAELATLMAANSPFAVDVQRASAAFTEQVSEAEAEYA